jgi:hypothetical protein
VLVQCLDQLELQAHQSSGVAPVNLDVRIFRMPLTEQQPQVLQCACVWA